jgi:putative Mn2+ efflux pump MntP
VGLAVGRPFVEAIGHWTDYLGPLAVGGYGLYVIYLAQRCKETKRDVGKGWAVFGLPLALSLDNLVAGVSLGMLGFPILSSALLIGTISGLMSLVGMKFGKAVERQLPIRAGLLGGFALVFAALTLLLETLG